MRCPYLRRRWSSCCNAKRWRQSGGHRCSWCGHVADERPLFALSDDFLRQKPREQRSRAAPAACNSSTVSSAPVLCLPRPMASGLPAIAAVAASIPVVDSLIPRAAVTCILWKSVLRTSSVLLRNIKHDHTFFFKRCQWYLLTIPYQVIPSRHRTVIINSKITSFRCDLIPLVPIQWSLSQYRNPLVWDKTSFSFTPLDFFAYISRSNFLKIFLLN